MEKHEIGILLRIYNDPMGRRWTFLTNHALVLLAIAEDPSLTLRQIGDRVGITERAAQKLVADLVEGGYVRSRRYGRRNSYHINLGRRLRHPLSREREIRDLLALLGGPPRSPSGTRM